MTTLDRKKVTRLLRALADRPRLTMAVKAAVAAALAWLVVQQLGGVGEDYPYYAPLGAVIATTATVASSLRATVQSVLAIFLGATVATAVGLLPWPDVAALAVAVAIGTLLSGWHQLGAMASWVPVSALFVLIIGESDPMHYVTAYLGLTTLGAVIGVAANVAFPALHLASAQGSQGELRDTLADQLDQLAEALERPHDVTPQAWADRKHAIEHQVERMRQAVTEAADARRANWRARAWREQAEEEYEQARALDQLSFLVEDLTGLLADAIENPTEQLPLGPELRGPAAEALRAMAETLRSVSGSYAAPECLARTHDANDTLASEVRVVGEAGGRDAFVGATMVTSIDRATSTLTPGPDESD